MSQGSGRLIDKVPCNNKKLMEERNGTEKSSHLCKVKEISNLPIFFGTLAKVHLSSPEDHLGNLNSGKWIMAPLDDKKVNHVVDDKVLSSRTKLNAPALDLTADV